MGGEVKNIGLKIALSAICVNAPRFVITFLAADGMRFPAMVEGTMLAITGIATGIVMTGGGAYIAHELIAMKGRFWSRLFMGATWVALLVFSVIILAPMMAAMLENSELATVLDTVQKRLQWSIASIVAIEILTAGAMVAHAATQGEAVQETAQQKSNAWSLVSNALAQRIATQLQPVEAMQPIQAIAQIATTEDAQPLQETAQDAPANDLKAQYIALRNAGRKHADLVREMGLNASTAASWWNRRSAQTQQFATGD